MKKRLKKVAVWFLIIFIAGVISLEIYTNICQCTRPEPAATVRSTTICQNRPEGYALSYSIEGEQILNKIAEKRAANEPISKDEYREAMDLLVYEAPPELLEGMNGVVCRDGIAFVRDSLPRQASLFVKRHELEHLFQTSSENQEVRANIAAGKEYPLGLLSTIVVSLIEAKSTLSWCCFLKSSWWIFKVYFLGIDDAV